MLKNSTDLVLDNIISYLYLHEIYRLKIISRSFYIFKITNWQQYPYRTRLDSLHYLYNLDDDNIWEDQVLIQSLGLNKTMYNSYSNGYINIFSDKIEALIIKKVYKPKNFYFRGQIPNLEYFSLLNIKILEISYTECNYLPVEIECLTNLDILIVNNNKFHEIPYPISKLLNLTQLDIHSNPIKKIASLLLNLKKLSYLDISNTMIKNIENIPLDSIDSVIVNGLSIDNISDAYNKIDILKVI